MAKLDVVCCVALGWEFKGLGELAFDNAGEVYIQTVMLLLLVTFLLALVSISGYNV